MRIEDCFSASTARNVVKAGDAIFKEGELGELMYVVLKGTFDVFVGGNLVSSFEAVEIIGEMAVIDPGPRSATVVAKTDCQLITLNQRKFMMLTEHKPEFALHVMKSLVERMRWLNMAAQAPATQQASQQTAPTNLDDGLTQAGEQETDKIGGSDAQTSPAVPDREASLIS